MSSGTIGELSVKSDHEIEWSIKNIFSYTKKKEYYSSPNFSNSGSNWYLQIYPNGMNGYLGGISLLLLREKSSQPPQGAIFTFGIKKADGTIKKRTKRIRWVFCDKENGFGYFGILQRSLLLQEKQELAPSDVLTITCDLRVKKSLDSTERLGTLSDNLLDLFTSKRGCDATLIVKEQKFEVHRWMLSARSSVFAAAFEADMKEKNTGVLDIVDCDPEAFREFLEYMYSGKIEKITSDVFELYKIADKYDVEELKLECSIFIMGNISLKNVFDTAILGEKFSEEEINFKTQEFFDRNFNDIVSSEKWDSFLKKNVQLASNLLKKMAPKIVLKKYYTGKGNFCSDNVPVY